MDPGYGTGVWGPDSLASTFASMDPTLVSRLGFVAKGPKMSVGVSMPKFKVSNPNVDIESYICKIISNFLNRNHFP